MVLKRLFRKRLPAGGSKIYSKESSESSTESYMKYLPEHIVRDNVEIFDDISSIHHCESVSSPLHIVGVGRSKNLSKSELNQMFPSNGMMHIVGEVEGAGNEGYGSGERVPANGNVTEGILQQLLKEEDGDEEEVGMEIDGEEEDESDDEQATFDETILDGVEIYHPRDDPKTLSADLSVFCLTLLKNEFSSASKKSLSERIVKNSLRQHFCVYSDTRQVEDDSEKKQNNKTRIEGALREDPEMIDTLALELISKAKYSQAIVWYKRLLETQKKCPDADTSETMSKLAILHLRLGNAKTAIGYAKGALKINREESRQAQAAISLMTVGLIHFGVNKSDVALRKWREALQMSCSVFGYDHPYVAILLNNIGCLHYQNGDFAASLKTFAESLDLQRKFLSSSVGCTNKILLDIATTKGNMAIIAGRVGDVDTATTLFEEVLSLQESVMPNRDHFVLKLTSYNMDRVSGRRVDKNSKQNTGKFFSTSSNTSKTYGTTSLNNSKTIGNSEVTVVAQTTGSLPVIRAESVDPSVFGDIDGIPLRRVGAKSPLDAMDVTDNRCIFRMR